MARCDACNDTGYRIVQRERGGSHAERCPCRSEHQGASALRKAASRSMTEREATGPTVCARLGAMHGAPRFLVKKHTERAPAASAT